MDKIIQDALRAYRRELDESINPDRIMAQLNQIFAGSENRSRSMGIDSLRSALGKARTIGTIDQMLKDEGRR